MNKPEGIKRIKVYVHRSKEENFDLMDALGVEGQEATSNLMYLGNEEELIYDINLKTGEAKLVAAGEFYLSGEKVTTGDLDEVET